MTVRRATVTSWRAQYSPESQVDSKGVCMAEAGALTDRDRLDIMDLLARYAQCLELGDLDGYVANFAPDGVLFEQHYGREAILQFVGGLLERRKTATDMPLHFTGF